MSRILAPCSSGAGFYRLSRQTAPRFANADFFRRLGCSALPVPPVFSYSGAMEVHFTPEQQAQLAQIATKAGTVPERLVTNVIARYLDEEARFLAAVEKGIAAAERGEFVEEEEMDARLEAMFKA